MLSEYNSVGSILNVALKATQGFGMIQFKEAKHGTQ
jgi:hypothetical protein